MTSEPAPGQVPGIDPDKALLEMLDLAREDEDLFRTTFVFPEPYPLYGGQVAAQAVRAASLTVPGDRLPHSLHGYFLRAGDSSRPTVLRVDRDRDGRSYSARRVVALQDDKVIFNMSISFHVHEEGPDYQITRIPDVPAPEECEPFALPRLFSMESRHHPDPVPLGNPANVFWAPTTFWARSTAQIGDDPLLNACALTYLSDISTGLFPLETEDAKSGASLDHAVWFHRPVRMEEWTLSHLVPHSVAAGRGLYTGSFFDRSGRLVATIAQEALFRPIR